MSPVVGASEMGHAIKARKTRTLTLTVMRIEFLLDEYISASLS